MLLQMSQSGISEFISVGDRRISISTGIDSCRDILRAIPANAESIKEDAVFCSLLRAGLNDLGYKTQDMDPFLISGGVTVQGLNGMYTVALDRRSIGTKASFNIAGTTSEGLVYLDAGGKFKTAVPVIKAASKETSPIIIAGPDGTEVRTAMLVMLDANGEKLRLELS